MKTPKEKKKEGGISIVSRNLLPPFANLPHLLARFIAAPKSNKFDSHRDSLVANFLDPFPFRSGICIAFAQCYYPTHLVAETRTVYQRERIEIRVMQRAMRAQLAAASFASRQDPFVLVSDSFSCVASVSIDRADDTRRNAVYCSFSRGSHCSLRDRNTSRSGLKFNLLLGFVRFEGRCIFVSFFYFSNVFIPTHCHKGRSYL